MIILGERYTFIESEISVMEKKFGKLNFVHYENNTESETIATLEALIKVNKNTLIVLNTKAKVPNALISFLTKLEHSGIEYMTLENFMETHLYKCYIDYENNDLRYLQDITGYSFLQKIQKFCIDIFGLFWLFFFSWPVMIYSYFKIKEQSPGKTFYIQSRVGLHAKEFDCIKFRSMKTDAEDDGIQFAKPDDARTFPYGESMRRKRFDELPQILNIFKFDMHLIGPRPERKHWVDTFEKNIPYYNERHIVRPGITGWAQVMYPYGENEEDARQKLMYDLYYIKNWSIWLEFKTVYLTALTVVGKKGV